MLTVKFTLLGLGLVLGVLAFYFSWYRWPPYKPGPKWQSVVIVVLYLSSIAVILWSKCYG